MNQKALKFLFDQSRTAGYPGTIDDYKNLISNNEEARGLVYTKAKDAGYTGSSNDFNNLIGVGKIQGPVKKAANAGSKMKAVTPAKNGVSNLEPTFWDYQLSTDKIDKQKQSGATDKILKEQIEKGKQRQAWFNQFNLSSSDEAEIEAEADAKFIPEDEYKPSFVTGASMSGQTYMVKNIPDDYKKYLAKANNNLSKAKELYIQDQKADRFKVNLKNYAEKTGDIVFEALTKGQEENAKNIEIYTNDLLNNYNNKFTELNDGINNIDESLKLISGKKYFSQEEADFANKQIKDLLAKRDALALEGQDIYSNSINIINKIDDQQKKDAAIIDITKRNWSYYGNIAKAAPAALDIAGGVLNIPNWLATSAYTAITGEKPKYGSEKNIVSEAFATLSKDIRSRLPMDIEKVKSAKDLGYWMTDVIGNQLPQLATMLAAPEISLPLISASAAGNKYQEMMDETDFYGKNYSASQLFITPLIVGSAEYLSEKITLGQIKSFRDILKSNPSILEAGKNYIENNILSPGIGGYAKRTAEESGSEALAKLAENIADIYILGKKDKSIWDNVSNAAAAGAFMSGVLYQSPAIGKLMVQPFMEEGTRQKLYKDQAMVAQLSRELYNLNKNNSDPIVIKQIEDAITTINKNSNKLISGTLQNVDNLDGDTKDALIENHRKNIQLQFEKKAILNNNDLSSATKGGLVKNINDKINDLLNKKAELFKNIDRKINPYEGLTEAEIDAKITDDIGKANLLQKQLGLTNTEIIEYSEKALRERGATEKQIMEAADPTSLGTFIEIGDGKELLVINKENAKKNKYATTAQHEFLHKVLFASVKNNPTLAKEMGIKLYNYLQEYTGSDLALELTEFGARIGQYSNRLRDGKISEADFFEEVMPLLSESLSRNDIKYSENLISKVGGLIRRGIQSMGVPIKFETGKDIFNFIVDYNKAFKKGELPKSLANLATMPITKPELAGIVKKSMALDQALKEKYKGDANALVNGMLTFPLAKSAFAQEIGGLTNTIARRLYDPIPAEQKIGITRNDFIEALIGDAATMVAREYKGLQNLDKFISNRLNLRANDLAKRLGIESNIKEDIEEREDIMAEASADEEIDIQEKEEALAREAKKAETFTESIDLNNTVDKVPLIDSFNAAINRNVILSIKNYDAEISANRTVTPFIQNIKNGLADDLENIMSRFISTYNGGYTKFLLDFKERLLFNYTTTYLSKNPLFKKGILKSSGGKTIKNKEGQAIFQPNWVAPKNIAKPGQAINYDWVDDNGNKLKIDRDNAAERGLTSGPIIMKRNPDINNIISDDEFVNFHYDDGISRKRVKANARKAITRQVASEMGFEIMKNDFQNEGPLFQAFKERADILGAALAENSALEIAKDIDRGTIKFSRATFNEKVLEQLDKGIVATDYLITNQLAKEIWDTAITRGPNSKAFKSYINNIDIDKNIIDLFLNNVINDRIFLLERAQKIRAYNKGIKYEKALQEMLKIQFGNNVKVRLISQIKGDLGVTIGNYSFAIELKLNDKAQVGSVTVQNILDNASLTKDIPLGNKLLEEINKQKDQFKNFINFAKKYGAEETNTGQLKTKNKEDWEIIKKEWGKALPEISFEMDQEAAMQLYLAGEGLLPVSLIHIGDIGTFAIKTDDFNRGIPELKATMQYIVRLSKNKNGASFRLFPNFKNIISKTQANLETEAGRKFLTDTIKSNIISKNNKDNFKSTKNSLAYNKESKGISVWDFDDTLAKTKSNVLYTLPNDTTVYKIDAADFALKSEELAAKGAQFDFSEFDKVTQGEKGPMFEKALARNKKFGNEHVYILTARPAESKFAIYEFLQGMGLDIRIENIIGLANGNPQAKADWIISKVAEGYNDFYFADDAYKNVKAVQDALSIYDVKSDVQQARIKYSEALNQEFNEIIEERFGIEEYKRFSEVVGRRRGYKKGKWKFFIPPSAEDFQGLLYSLYGKGKRGELQKEWFDQALVLPYIQGVAKLEKAKQAIHRSYKNFLKNNKEANKRLKQKISDGDFTYDQALRVYLWTNAGYEIPGLSQRDQLKLNDIIANDDNLVALAGELQRMSMQEKGWIKPGEYWDGETLLSDLEKLTEGVSRKEYLQEFIQNADIIFSKENKNKLRAAVGNEWVDAMENAIIRMKSGVNHVAGADAITNKWNQWVSNSVGAIMFLNRRSALLQLISATNFLNWSDNNPLKAAEAFANQKQYWADWTYIFNSDKLKERRGGLKTDVTESEIANVAEGAKNKVSAIISWLLKVGFTPTQIADSIAIASGGATFYRNRANTYIKQGMPKADAEEKAFIDFSRLSDEAQQSSDPLLVSKEQSTTAGRLILAFANTPMQYMRLTKKAGLDLINGRGDAKSNIGKIVYYVGIQNLIFSALQSALFALIPGFDDDGEEIPEDQVEREQKQLLDILNSMSDTILRGVGIYGAIVSTAKNMAITYMTENEKDAFKQDMDKIVISALSLSPPIGSKAQKLKGALATQKFEKDVMEARGWNILVDGKYVPNPRYEMIGKATAAIANIPIDRIYDETASIAETFDSRNTNWQRVALAMGYKTWQIGADLEENDLIKAKAKQERKEAGKEKAKAKRSETKKIKSKERLRRTVDWALKNQ